MGFGDKARALALYHVVVEIRGRGAIFVLLQDPGHHRPETLFGIDQRREFPRPESIRHQRPVENRLAMDARILDIRDHVSVQSGSIMPLPRPAQGIVFVVGIPGHQGVSVTT